MNVAVFPILSHGDVTKVIAYLNQHHSQAIADGEPLVVNISTKMEKRTHAQNRLYWLWLSDLARETGNDKETLHFNFKYKYLISIYMRDDPEFNEMALSIKELKNILGETDIFKAIRDGVIRETSTTKANTKQMTEYLNNIFDECVVKHGIRLKVPDDLAWAWER